MITLNNKHFSLNDIDGCNFTSEKNDKGITDVFISGYYRVYKKQVALFDINHNKIGVITNNVLGKATKQNNGKYWYSYGTIKEVGEYSSYRQECNDIKKVMDLLN